VKLSKLELKDDTVKIRFSFLLALALWLSACTASVPATPPENSNGALPSATPNLPTATAASSCSVVHAEPTPASASLFPAVSETDFALGPADAAVTVIEYCDFQAPGCRQVAAVISQIVHKRPNDVRFVFRPLPLIGVLDKSEQAVRAALAANEQGKFWEMYDLLFQGYDSWVNLKPAEFDAWLKQQALLRHFDGKRFEAAYRSQETADRLKSGYEAAKKLGIPSVPLVLVNGIPQPAYLLDFSNLDDTIALIALGKRQFTTCPPFVIETTKQYVATLHTAKGDVVLQLFADKAPLAVNSFVFLARQGWFNGITFHRVIPGFVAQSGDPSGTGRGNPGYFFKNEISPDLKFDRPGVVGMANSGPDTNGSQFFITYAAAPHLDGSYTIFGQVIRGMDVLENLTPRDPSSGIALPPGDTLLSVEIEEK
jgi:cyclophilin family peptidyl-prolyl cis-trans isomerase/protein-disulfide isomerase